MHAVRIMAWDRLPCMGTLVLFREYSAAKPEANTGDRSL